MTWTDCSLSAGRARARRILSGLALSSLLLVPRLGFAQSGSDAAAARALFSEGRKLADEGKFSEACPKFQESLRLKPGIGTRFNLADCWEKLGRTASAWGEFLEVATAAKAQGQKDRETVARERARVLEAKLSYLVVEVEETDPELRVTRDGVEIGRGGFGTSVPVDPGQHVIAATSPTKKPWSVSEDVKGGQKSRVVVPKLTPLDAAEPAPKAAPVVASAEQVPTRAEPAPPTDAPSSGGFGAQRALGLGLGGLGVVGIAAGTVFLIGYNSKNSEAKQLCPTGTCSGTEMERHEQLLEDARTQRTLSYVSFGAGGLLLAGGAVLFFTAPSRKEQASTVRVVPLISRSVSGLVLDGAF